MLLYIYMVGMLMELFKYHVLWSSPVYEYWFNNIFRLQMLIFSKLFIFDILAVSILYGKSILQYRKMRAAVGILGQVSKYVCRLVWR